MSVKKPGIGSYPAIWEVTESVGVITLHRPNGSTQKFPVADPLALLRTLAAADPEINRLHPEQEVTITCSDNVRDVLPLWLAPVDDAVAGCRASDEFNDFIDESMPWITRSYSHYLIVNDEKWVIIVPESVGYGVESTERCAVPNHGDYSGDFLEVTWGSFGFSESGSMTSGWDSSALGLLTARVVASVDTLDEAGANVRLAELADRTEHFKSWVGSNWLGDQLRETWDIPDGDDDFIGWGFLKLAERGGGTIDLRGNVSYDSDGMGIGLTTTSDWTFTSSLPPEQILEALGDLHNRRPGGQEPVLPPIMLQYCLEAPEEERLAHGWVPTVGIPAKVRRAVASSLRDTPSLTVAECQVGNLERDIAGLGAERARQLLGLRPTSSLSDAWHARQSLSARNADHFEAAHDAYWTLVRVEALQRDLVFAGEARARAAGIAERARSASWTCSWDVRYADVWLDLGGSAAAAERWALAGWKADTVLTCGRIGRYWNPTLAERVVLEDVPTFDAPDLPPEGVEPWPCPDLHFNQVVWA